MLCSSWKLHFFYESICVHFPFTMTREFGLAGEGGEGCFIICVHFPFTMTREFGLAGEGGGVVSSSVFIFHLP